MARAGHVSVTVDRLGYGASDKPASGKARLHRLAGRHRAPDRRPAEGRVLHRHGRQAARSSSGWRSSATRPPARSRSPRRTPTGTCRRSWSSASRYSNLPRGNDEFGFQRIACDKGGDPVAGPDRLRASSAAPPRASAARCSAARRRRCRTPRSRCTTRDPCGDNYSLIDTIQRQAANVGKVKVPVLVVCGRNDVLYAPFGCEAQAERFSKGSTLILRNTGHGVPLERTRQDVPQAPFPLPRALRSLAFAPAAPDSRDSDAL